MLFYLPQHNAVKKAKSMSEKQFGVSWRRPDNVWVRKRERREGVDSERQ